MGFLSLSGNAGDFGTAESPPKFFARRETRGRDGTLTDVAQVAELVDALVSGTSAERRGGSSPLLGTTDQMQSSQEEEKQEEQEKI